MDFFRHDRKNALVMVCCAQFLDPCQQPVSIFNGIVAEFLSDTNRFPWIF
jgi:hypothetical protein